ncbi:MAG TPA: OpgC domain-containing protein [Candidatus Saccharimonadales bacterium]
MNSDKGSEKTPSARILALDYLRGFFIIVIIVDHLWRWPNLFQFVSGRGELWASAAEGFVIISGLLVGYIRGYKNRNKPLGEVSKKLAGRGVMLYVWMIITSLALVGASWLLDFKGSMAHVPIPEGNWWELIVSTLSVSYVHTLTHFLYLYAIFLVIAPGVIWLMRKGKSWIVAVLSMALWGVGVLNSIEWMQWQVLFFLPTIAGFYFESILAWYRGLTQKRRDIIRFGSIGTLVVTVLLAMNEVLAHMPGDYENTLFSRDPITFGTLVTAFAWFIGLLSLFQLLLPLLKKYLGWLLLPFGERSLTAYILHTIPLVACAMFLSVSDNFVVNTIISLGCILTTWAIVKIPGINRVIPR